MENKAGRKRGIQMTKERKNKHKERREEKEEKSQKTRKVGGGRR